MRPLLFTPLLFVFSGSSAQHVPESGGFKIAARVELVLLDASVKDSKGGYVSGLTKNEFRIYENGDLQKISEFSSADIPVAVGLVMDASGSMEPKRQKVNAAGVAFVEASNPQDQIFVVNFNDKVRHGLPESVPFTDNLKLLRSALSKNRPEGRTAMYDAIAYSLKHLESGQREKRALIVVSDGGDNCSVLNLKELIGLIQQSRTTIYTVGIFDSDDPDRNPGVLKRIANVSGGECFLPDQADQIVLICRKIAKDIRNRYTIGYSPVRSDGVTALRNIHVVAAAAHRKLNVKTRTSYIRPALATSVRNRAASRSYPD